MAASASRSTTNSASRENHGGGVPFENLTGDESQDYFSDGLTEEMIAQLGRLDPKEFGVIARTSVMHYQHSQRKWIRSEVNWTCNTCWKGACGAIPRKCELTLS